MATDDGTPHKLGGASSVQELHKRLSSDWNELFLENLLENSVAFSLQIDGGVPFQGCNGRRSRIPLLPCTQQISNYLWNNFLSEKPETRQRGCCTPGNEKKATSKQVQKAETQSQQKIHTPSMVTPIGRELKTWSFSLRLRVFPPHLGNLVF